MLESLDGERATTASGEGGTSRWRQYQDAGYDTEKGGSTGGAAEIGEMRGES